MKFLYFVILILFFFQHRAQQSSLVLKDFESEELQVFVNVKFFTKSDSIVLQTNAVGTITSDKIFANSNKVYFKVLSVFYEDSIFEWHKSELKKVCLVKMKQQWMSPLVVTAEFKESSVENSIHKVKVIDQQRIETLGAVNLRDVLNVETNIRISQDGVLGSSMSIQGVQGENIKIMIDGVPVIGRLNGSIDLSQINLDNIERIEIIEGPMSVNYGTDALGGTINLITKKVRKDLMSLNLNTYYESIGQYNCNGGLSFKKNKNTISLNMGRNYFDGWMSDKKYTLLPIATLADTNRVHSWNPKEQFFLNSRFTTKLKNIEMSLFFDAFEETIWKRGAPKKPYYVSAFDDTYQTFRINYGLNLDGKLAKKHKFNVVVANNNFKRTKNTWFVDLTNMNNVLTENIQDQDTSWYSGVMSRGVLMSTFDSSKVSYNIGYEVNVESAKGKRIIETDRTYADFSFFSTANISIGKSTTIKPGVRIIKNTIYKAPVIPSLNIKANYKSFTFRTSYARGFRAPGLKELFFEFVDINHNIVGNDKLKAETSHNFQFHVNYRKVYNKTIFKIELSSYLNLINNQIRLALTEETNQYTYINVESFKSKGISSNMSLNFDRLTLNFGAVYNGIYNSIENQNGNESKNEYLFTPELNSSLQYKVPKVNALISTYYKYTGVLNSFGVTENGEIALQKISDFHTMDISLSKVFFKSKLRVILGVKNLFNVTNLDASFASFGAHSGSGNSMLMAWGRSYFVSLKLNI